MKRLLTIAIIGLLFTSCTKENPYQAVMQAARSYRLLKITMYMDEQHDINYAKIQRELADPRTGQWLFVASDFESPTMIKDKIYFNELDSYGDPSGTIEIQIKFMGSLLTDYTYSGKGEWYIVSSTGTLYSFLSKGAGQLTYKEIKYPPSEEGGVSYPEYEMELVGYTQ